MYQWFKHKNDHLVMCGLFETKSVTGTRITNVTVISWTTINIVVNITVHMNCCCLWLNCALIKPCAHAAQTTISDVRMKNVCFLQREIFKCIPMTDELVQMKCL